MIEGLKVIIPGAKVAALASARAEYHKEKVQHYNDAKASAHTLVRSCQQYVNPYEQ